MRLLKLEKQSPMKIILTGFCCIILLGGLLLSLPAAARSGVSTNFLDAVFTATSATCVTGLIRFDTYTYWSLFGQIIIQTGSRAVLIRPVRSKNRKCQIGPYKFGAGYGLKSGNIRSDRKGQIKCTVGNREKLNKTVRQRSRVWPGKSARSKTRKFKIGPKLCKNTSLRKINKPLIV